MIEDLFAYRDQLLEALPNAADGKFRVGLPRAMAMLDHLPFWRRYFAELGIPTVLSPVTDPRISADGIEMAVAQPCYPVQVAHGHVQALINQGVDYVLLPNLVDADSGGQPRRRALLPLEPDPALGAARRRRRSNRTSTRFLIPTLHFQLGPAQVKKALAETMRRIGVKRRASDRAVDAAYAAQRGFQDQLLEAGRRASRRWMKPASPAWCWPDAATTSTTAA